MSLGRAYLLKAQAEGDHRCEQARAYIDTAVGELRATGQRDYIPRGLLARAELYIFTRDFVDARADLNEAYGIATRDPQGHMKLHVADYHLLSARLELAQADAEAEAAKEESDDAERATPEGRGADHRNAAREHVAAAAALIDETGYHRRDGELAELGERAG